MKIEPKQEVIDHIITLTTEELIELHEILGETKGYKCQEIYDKVDDYISEHSLGEE
mgnify:CR=1 FL=1